MSGLNLLKVTVPKPPLKILLAAPRGFCAGVDRAIQIVEQALTKFGAPVYVRHEIVHNRYVVDSLKAKGAVFVKELDEIPDTTQPVIFSAHGVAKAIPAAHKRGICSSSMRLVPWFRRFIWRRPATTSRAGKLSLLGTGGHPEVVGTLGQLPTGAIHLVELADDARAFVPRDLSKLAYVTQTTLSLDDTAEIVAVLKERFPGIGGPVKEDICYATTNRQNAVKAIAPQIDGLIVVGGPKSSNSLRLVEVAERAGCKFSFLVERAENIPWSKLEGATVVGITAGASAPEVIVEEVVEAFRERYDVTIDVVTTLEERVIFNVPREVRLARTPAEQH